MIDPKPAKRIVRPAIVRNQTLLEPRCRLCNQVVPVNAHHVVPRSVGGDDVYENLVTLCGSGTTGCHGKVEAREEGWRSRLRDRLYPAEVDYAVAKKGWVWLNRHYPMVEQ